MKKLILSTVIAFLIFNYAFAQHPNSFIADVYDLAWLKDSNIKTIKAGKSEYNIQNGVPISTKSRNVRTLQDGKVIMQSQGTKSFPMNILSVLSDDLTKLESNTIGNIKYYYFYNDEGLLHYKISDMKSKVSTSIADKFKSEEIERDLDGKITKKEVYRYKKSLLDIKDDLEKIQSLDKRELTGTWKYFYNEKGQLDKIEMSSKIKDEWKTTIISIVHKNNLPVELTFENTDGTTFIFGKKKRYTYSFE